jgi:hypothetical protein
MSRAGNTLCSSTPAPRGIEGSVMTEQQSIDCRSIEGSGHALPARAPAEQGSDIESPSASQ